MAAPADPGPIVQLAFGQLAGHAVASAVILGVADLIDDGQRSGAEVAGSVGAAPGPVNRLLRALAALGLLTEVEPGTFRLTPSGALLRTDRPDSLHEFVWLLNNPLILAPFSQLSTALRTGKPIFQEVHGISFFEYLAKNPEHSRRFNAAMHQVSVMVSAQLPTSYGFGRFHTVLDVGGGTLLAMLLGANPRLRGIVYDTEPGVAEAGTTFTTAGVSERATIVAGDFFA